MKKFTKWLMILVLLIVVLIGAAISYIKIALPNVGQPENVKVVYTPQRIAHGKYLATRVAVCMDCHSTRDFSRLSGPIDTNRIGAGGDRFDASVGFPGNVVIPNITPYHLKDWTDGELFRAITTGVKKDGSAIFPIMPWSYYGRMDREDIYDIIAYIRSLKPIKADYPARKLDFPLNIIVNTMPQKAAFSKRPAESDTVKYGAYLVQTAACMECHTKDDKGTLLPGLEFAGGREFRLGNKLVRSANITPDVTGIGTWTQDQFVKRFQYFGSSETPHIAVGKTDFQTVMPWTMLGKMKETDLKAMYAYLRTVKPVKNVFVKYELLKPTAE